MNKKMTNKMNKKYMDILRDIESRICELLIDISNINEQLVDEHLKSVDGKKTGKLEPECFEPFGCQAQLHNKKCIYDDMPF